jgi:iron complex transport system substrate-binding protein
MKNKFSTFILAVFLAAMTITTSCSNRGSDSEQAALKSKEITPAEKTVTVTDHLGRTVTLEKPAEKIVSGYYISTSALISLGLEDRLVGVEAKADTRPIYFLSAPDILKLPNVGTAKQFDLEGCIKLNPDLVILPIKLKDQINTLETMGIKVIGVNPENKELLFETMEMIGKLTGTERYKGITDYYREKEDEIKNIYTGASEKPKVYIAGNSSMLSTATSKMYQNDLIESAGGINVAGSIDGTYWAEISYEQLVKFNPDYIIIAPEAGYSAEDIAADPNISMVSAVVNKRIYQMPKAFEAWDSPVPSSILGEMWLTSILYDDKYPYEKFEGEVYSFYKTFYGFEADKNSLEIGNNEQQ